MEMEEPSDSGVSESGLAEPGLWLPDFIEKLQSVKLTPQEDRIPKKDISQEEIISYKSSPCSLQRYNELSPEAASQVLWATGTYSGRIPNGFYSVIPAHSPQKMAALVSKQIHLRGALRLALSCFEQDATGSVDKKLKEMFKTIPSLDELSSMGIAGSRAEAVLVDVEKDKKLFMLKQWSAALLKGHHSNPASIIKKLAKLVSECYKRSSDQSLGKKYTEETSQLPENKGFSLLGQVRVASCRPRALLFKALADAVNLECKLIVGVPTDGPVECMDSYKHLSAVVVLNSVELLVDLTQFPGQLIPFSSKAIFKYHISAAGESDSADNDSCDSPLEPNSPLCGLSDKLDGEGSAISSHEHEEGIQSLNNRQAETSSIASPPLRNVMMQSLGLPEGTLSTHHSEPNIANAVWRPDSRRKAVAEQHTASSSPEHPLFWARGRSILARSRQSIREHTDGAATSRSVGASTTEPLRIRRRSISIAPEIGDDIVRAVRAMNEALKQNKCQGNEDVVSYSHREKNSCRDVSATCSNLRNQSNTSSNQKSMSLPSSPHEFSAEISERNGDTELKRRDFLSIWNRVLQSSPFVNQPLLPFDVWNIDYSELRVGARVGIGCFGEVFHGIWNGTDVAIKVFLEQDLTAENMEIFCNEISILSCLRHPNVILFLGACMRPPRLSMVTEYMEMGSLYYLIHTGGQKEKLSWHRRIKILQDICRGLMCMHRMKIVHRDLKSANCLVDRHWTVKICDFGLSRMITDAPMRDSSSAGTPEWMAPELIRNEPFTEKCDIFSLGVIMWELCTLSRPWKGVPPVQVIYAVASKGMQLHIPEGPLGKLIADCWAEPDERPSCQGVLSQLLDCNCTLC